MKKFISLLLVIMLGFTIEYTPISANATFENKRLIVYTNILENNYNATSSSFSYGAYTLEYESEKATAIAYNNLIAEYGVNNVVIDINFNLYSFIQENYENKVFYQYLPNIRTGIYPLIQDINDYAGNKEEIIVGVIDTGIDTDTSFYNDRYLFDQCTSFISDGDLAEGDPEDTDGHGTSVCFAVANSSPDNVKIISYKIFDADGDSSLDAVRKALYQAYEDGVDIINMSWGGDSSFAVLERDLSFLHNANITMFAAAGNEGTETVDDVYPAYSKYTIAVSSVSNDKVGDKYAFSDFSTYGSSIDFSSPGDHISLSTNDGRIYYCTGTSFSTPILSGQLATLKTFVDTNSKEEDVNLLKRYISSDFDVDYALDANYKSNQYGYGYLDFSDTRLCTCSESNCHMVYHDSVAEIPSETASVSESEQAPSEITSILINEDTETTTDGGQQVPTITIPAPVTTTIAEITTNKNTSFIPSTDITNNETTLISSTDKNIKVKVPKKLRLKIKKRSIIISCKKRKKKDKVIILISKRKKFKTIKKIVTKKKQVKYKPKRKGYYYIKIRTLRIINEKKYFSKYSKVKRIKV